MGKRGKGPGRLIRKQLAQGGSVYVGDWTDGRGRRRRVQLGTDRQDAQRRLSKLVRDRDLEASGMKVEEGLDVAFALLVEEYLADVRIRATPKSLACRSESLACFVKLRCVVAAREVTPLSVQAFIRERVAQGRAPRTVNNDLLSIQACLNHAVRSGRIAANPIASVRRLSIQGTGRQLPRALSESECVELLGAAVAREGESAHARPLLLRALIETGARWGEMTAVTWSDILWLQRAVRLRAETTKNRTERVIPLGDELLLLLRAVASQRFGAVKPHGDALVFLSPWGHPCGLPHNFRRWLRETLELAQVARRDEHGRVVNVHALRHTFVTRLARAGVPIQHAAYLTGHKTLAILMQVYTHLQVEDARQAIAQLSLSGGELGNKLALPRGAQDAASGVDVTSSPASEGCDGGPPRIRTGNFHAVNMAL